MWTVYCIVVTGRLFSELKVVAKLIEREKVGVFAGATILTTDDGTTVLEQLRNELSADRPVHFILMDFIMVRALTHLEVMIAIAVVMFSLPIIPDDHGWARAGPRDETGPPLQRSYHHTYGAACHY